MAIGTEIPSGTSRDGFANTEEGVATDALGAKARVAVIDLHPAANRDVPAIVVLMNRAYRGSGAEAGWNSEADYIDGDRTTEVLLHEELAAKPKGTLLLWRRSQSVQGCVWLEPLGGDTWYLGSLTIDPHLQNAGFGRQLLTASEDWVRERGGREIRMTVVNVRDSVLAWYARRGYRATGETEPFPYDDARFGIPKRSDLSFVVLQKQLQ